MPNSKQGAKRLRQDEVRRVRNKSTRTAMRSAVKKVLTAETKEEAASALPLAMKKVDKAAKSSVVHKNAAARIKSRLARSVKRRFLSSSRQNLTSSVSAEVSF